MHKSFAVFLVLFAFPVAAMDPDDHHQEPRRVLSPVSKALPVLRSGATTRWFAKCRFDMNSNKSFIDLSGVLGEYVATIEQRGAVSFLAEGSDGTRLICASSDSICMYNLTTQQTIVNHVAPRGTRNTATAEALSDGLLMIGHDGQMRHFGTEAQNMGKLFKGRVIRCAALVRGERSRVAAVTGSRANGFDAMQRLEIADFKGEVQAKNPIPGLSRDLKVIERFPGRPELLVLNHDGNHSKRRMHITIHDAETAQKIAELRLPSYDRGKYFGESLSVAPDSSVFAVTARSGRTQIHDAQSLMLLSDIDQPGRSRELKSASFFAQGSDGRCYLLSRNVEKTNGEYNTPILETFRADLPYLWKNQKRHVMPSELEEARVASHSAVCALHGRCARGIIGSLQMREINGRFGPLPRKQTKSSAALAALPANTTS